MKGIVLLSVLLITVAAHAEDQAKNMRALTNQVREVERQLVRSGLPENDAQETVRAMVRARFTEEQIVQVGKQLALENRFAIEGQAIRDKIHEGIAKGVSPANILSATSRVQSRFAYSRRLAKVLDEAENVSIVTMYADCLAAGLTEQHADQLAHALKAKSATSFESGNRSLKEETLAAARDMVRRSISSATTTEVLERALAHGYGAEEMRSLRRGFSGSSGDVETMAKRYGAAIEQGVHAGDLGRSGAQSGEKSGGGGGQGASGGSEGGSSGSGRAQQLGVSARLRGRRIDGGSTDPPCPWPLAPRATGTHPACG